MYVFLDNETSTKNTSVNSSNINLDFLWDENLDCFWYLIFM